MQFSASAISSLLDHLEERGIECHSLMVVHRGRIVAEGWWAPYSADQPHLLYSLTKSFTSVAVGIAVNDGLLRLDDRVVDILPDHVPDDASEQARALTVQHLLTMTTGHAEDTLGDAWALEPTDLVRGFLRMPVTAASGSHHTYDNSSTFVLARMVERVTGTPLPTLLDERLFAPLGITDIEWDRVGDGAVYGFHGLHLTTESVAAFGELMLRGGEWQGRPILSQDWMAEATRKQVDSRHYSPGAPGVDFHAGYGYQIWSSTYGFHGNGAFGQQCIVVPDQELVVVLTAAHSEVRHAQVVLDAVRRFVVPGVGGARDDDQDAALARRMSDLSLPMVEGTLGGASSAICATLDASPAGSALAEGTPVVVEQRAHGWIIRLGLDIEIAVGFDSWRESRPLGRPVVSSGAWQRDTFVADLHLVTSPHRVRLTVRKSTAHLVWVTVSLTTSDLTLHLKSPLMTRPDMA